MAIPVVQASQIFNQTSNASTTGAITLALGTIEEDNIIFLACALDGDAANVTAAGYTLIGSASEGACEIYYLFKRQGAVPDTEVTINWTGNEQGRFLIFRVSGALETGDPIDVVGTVDTQPSGTTITVPRPVSLSANTLFIAGGVVDRNRVDSGDGVISGGSRWTHINTPGSSGGANGVGLLVAEADEPTLGGNVIVIVFGTWASDQQASRCFVIKEGADPPAPTDQFINQDGDIF